MVPQKISPAEARAKLERGEAILVDIREPMEHARENIPGAKLAPLSRFEAAGIAANENAPAVIFHCQSGGRTNANAARLGACGVRDVYVLEGGLSAWKAAGLPTRLDRSQPIEMQRQVQIAAGSLILLGLALAFFVSPWFIGLTAFVGCGLVFAGISGWCGMAKLLALMRWNRVA